MTEKNLDQLVSDFIQTPEYQSLLTTLPKPQIAYILNEFKAFVNHHGRLLSEWQRADWTDFTLFTQIRRQAKGRRTTLAQLKQILAPWGYYLMKVGATQIPPVKFQAFLNSLDPDPEPLSADGLDSGHLPEQPDLPEWKNEDLTVVLNDLQEWLVQYAGSDAGHKRLADGDDAYLPIVEFVIGAYRFFRQTPATLTEENVKNLMLNQYVTESLISEADVPRVLPLLTSFFEFLGHAGLLEKEQAMAILAGLAQVADDYPEMAIETWRFSESKQLKLQQKAVGRTPKPLNAKQRAAQAVEAQNLLMGRDYDETVLDLPELAGEPLSNHVIHVEGTVWDYHTALMVHDIGLTNGVAVWLQNVHDATLDQLTVVRAVALATDWMYALYLEKPDQWQPVHFAEMVAKLSPEDRRIMKHYLTWSREDNQHTPDQIAAMLQVVEAHPGANVVSFEAEKRRLQEDRGD